MTPAPTSKTGRSRRVDAARRHARCPRSPQRRRWIGPSRRRAVRRSSIGSFWTSFGMSTTTGPGRPDVAMRKASGTTVEQLGRRAHQEVVLRDRHGQAVGVDLLEGVGADHRARHLAGDGDERDRVELGVGDRGEQVRRARAPRCRSRRPAHPVARAMPCAMKPAPCSWRARTWRIWLARERVVERQVGAAGDAGDRRRLPGARAASSISSAPVDLHGSSPFGVLPARLAARIGGQKTKPPPASRRQGFGMRCVDPR